MKVLLLVFALIISCFADEIEIKGLKIGMSKDDVSKIYSITKSPSRDGDGYYLSQNSFTIGGSKVFDTRVYFAEDKSDHIEIVLYSSSFENVLSALKDKYKDLKCVNSEIKNKLGNSFTQTICEIKDDKSSLQFKRLFELNFDRSILDIKSTRKINIEKTINQASKKDI